jgi:hypothetical protein
MSPKGKQKGFWAAIKNHSYLIVLIISAASLFFNFYQYRESNKAKLIGNFRYQLPYICVETDDMAFAVFLSIVNSGKKPINVDYSEIYYDSAGQWKRGLKYDRSVAWVPIYKRIHLVPERQWHIEPGLLDTLLLENILARKKTLGSGDMEMGWVFVITGKFDPDHFEPFLDSKIKFQLVDISGKRYSIEGKGVPFLALRTGWDFQAGLTIDHLSPEEEREADSLLDVIKKKVDPNAMRIKD